MSSPHVVQVPTLTQYKVKNMNCIIRPVTKDDEQFLWKILYYAAHMDEDGETSLDAAKSNPILIKYVKDWGYKTDIGFIALEPHS